jgi:hypothetical protein
MASLRCDGEVRVASVEGEPGYDVTCTRPGCDWERHTEYASRALSLHHDHLLKRLDVTNATTQSWAEGVMSTIQQCRIAV